MSRNDSSDDSVVEGEDGPESSMGKGLGLTEGLGMRSCSPQSSPFGVFDDSWDNNNRDSFVTALENPTDLSSPPPDNVGGVMSTIEEESRSYETSTAASASKRGLGKDDLDEVVDGDGDKSKRDRDGHEGLSASQELKELQQLVEETSQELKQKTGVASAASVPVPKSAAADSQQGDQDEDSSKEIEGLDALLLKLEKLESAQNVLEEALNAGAADDIDIDQFIAQLPLDPAQLMASVKRRQSGEEDRSFSSEIASIQKLLDSADLSLSVNSEVAGGNNNLLSTESNPKENVSGERSVEDVLKEYEEFERSFSRASAIDESFRSDISSIPPHSVSSNQFANKTVPETAPEIVTPPSTIPIIKPPVLKTVALPSTTNSAAVAAPIASQMVISNSTRDNYYYSSGRGSHHHHGQDPNESNSRPRPMTFSNIGNNKNAAPKSTKIESSQSSHGLSQPSRPGTTGSAARVTSSAIVTSNKDTNEDAYKPRNRRMRSPMTVNSPRLPRSSFEASEIPTNASAKGGGEGYQASKKDKGTATRHKNKTKESENMEAVIASEALKTIEKLNTMVARQETLLEAYSKDNEKLWGQLREAKSETQEKEGEFQEIINSLKTEVATLKVNRLVTAPVCNPPVNPKSTVEFQRLQENSELKSQQLLELRKEILVLQRKLSEKGRSPVRTKQVATSQIASQEKEKEYQKTITGLNKQVRTLQRILYSKEESAPPPPPPASEITRSNQMQRAKSDVGARSRSRSTSTTKQQPQQQKPALRNPGVDASDIISKKSGATLNKSVGMNTGKILQASLHCMEQEREEFENIIEDKNKIIFDKEKTILDLRKQIENLKRQLPEGEVVDPGLIDELRSRIITQNKVIQTLKDHLSSFKKLEMESLLLREEKRTLERLAEDLQRKLDFAQSLVKPENEVLTVLSEKVAELSSRYYRRERQLDSLLNVLSVKTTTGGGGAMAISSSSSNDSVDGAVGFLHSANLSPRRRLPLDQFSNNNGSLGGQLLTSSSVVGKGRSSGLISADILHMVDLSPTNSLQLFNTEPDLPEM